MSKEDDSENEVRLQNEIAQEPTPEPINDEDINAIQEEDHEQSSNHEEGDMEGQSDGPKEIVAELETDEYEGTKVIQNKIKSTKYDLEGNMRFRPIIDETSARLARRLVQGKAHDRLHKQAKDYQDLAKEIKRNKKAKQQELKEKDPNAVMYENLNNGERLYQRS